MDQRDETLARWDPKRVESCWRPENRRSPPVAGQAVVVSAEQHRVNRTRGCTQVFLLFDRVLGADRARGHQRRRALELGSRLGASSLLQPRESLGADHAEPPGVCEVMV